MDTSLNQSASSPAPFGSATSANVVFSGPAIESMYAALSSGADGDGNGGATSSAAAAAVDSGLYGLSASSLSPSLRELGDDAVWSLSSAKQGNGVEQLRDDDTNTFWQSENNHSDGLQCGNRGDADEESDGVLPHSLTIQFHKKTRVSCVCLYLDQKLDESYSPSRISIRVGSGAPAAGASAAQAELGGALDAMEVREVERFELEEPQGWLICHLRNAAEENPWGTGEADKPSPVRCHFVQVVVLASHQNGRDTHIRQVKIFGPRNWSHRGVLDELASMSTIECRQFAQIR